MEPEPLGGNQAWAVALLAIAKKAAKTDKRAGMDLRRTRSMLPSDGGLAGFGLILGPVSECLVDRREERLALGGRHQDDRILFLGLLHLRHRRVDDDGKDARIA